MKATQTAAPPTTQDMRTSMTPKVIGWVMLARNIALPLAVSLLSLWVAVSGLPERTQAPHNAVIVLGILTLVTAFIARRAREQLSILDEGSGVPNMLPDLVGSLYLVILVLVGAPAAIVFAIITPFIARAPELWREPRGVVMALRQCMTSSLTLLVAGFAYASVSAVIPHVPTSLRAHVLAAFAAAAVFLVGTSLARLVLFQPTPRADELLKSTRDYLTGPGLLFQILLLSCVPLLPLTESLQPVEIEFAWVLLLTPMGAVFYLALTSVRLRQQTERLQRTVTELNATRLRETQLKSYAALITRAQEDERRRLARELHDDTAQALIALSRGLDALSDRHINPVSSPEDMRFLDQLVELTQRTLDSVRRACQDLRPSVLDDLGLSAALESLAGAMTDRGLPCQYREFGTAKPYPPEVEVAVYRIAQEALSNALRHSNPQQARIELRYRPAGLRLVVSDDGHGFDVSATLAGAPGGASRSSAAENGSGLGLMGMRERAALIGATLDIQSAPGSGARITLDAPATSLPTLPEDLDQLSEITLPSA